MKRFFLPPSSDHFLREVSILICMFSYFQLFAIHQTWWYTDCILSCFCQKRVLQRSGCAIECI